MPHPFLSQAGPSRAIAKRRMAWGTIASGAPAERRRALQAAAGASSTAAWLSAAVHPHACGEDWCEWVYVSLDAGSSPRVWGRLADNSAQARSTWFTPTRVGKTQPPSPPIWQELVHPHACGEDCKPARRICAAGRGSPACGEDALAAYRIACSQSGSPPRVWGRHQRDAARDGHARFTPTRVGKTCQCCCGLAGGCSFTLRVWGRRGRFPMAVSE